MTKFWVQEYWRCVPIL